MLTDKKTGLVVDTVYVLKISAIDGFTFKDLMLSKNTSGYF